MILSVEYSIESSSTMVSTNGEPYWKIGRGKKLRRIYFDLLTKNTFFYVAKNGLVALHVIYIYYGS